MEPKNKRMILALASGLAIIVVGAILARYVQQGALLWPESGPVRHVAQVTPAGPTSPPPSPTPIPEMPKGPTYLAVSAGCDLYVMAQNDLGYKMAGGGYERLQHDATVPVIGLGDYVPTAAGTWEVYSEVLKNKGTSYADKWTPDQANKLLACLCRFPDPEFIAKELAKYKGAWDLERLHEAAKCSPLLMPVFDEAVKKQRST